MRLALDSEADKSYRFRSEWRQYPRKPAAALQGFRQKLNRFSQCDRWRWHFIRPDSANGTEPKRSLTSALLK